MTQATDLAAEVAGLEKTVMRRCDIPACNCTEGHPDGSVPLFPWSRRECADCQGKGVYDLTDPITGDMYIQNYACTKCSGLGWLPLDPGDMAQRALEYLGSLPDWSVQVGHLEGRSEWYTGLFRNGRLAIKVDEPTWQHAVLAALLRYGKEKL